LTGDLKSSWRGGVDTIKTLPELPEAIEIHFDKDLRTRWGKALSALERFRLIAKESWLHVTSPWPILEPCDTLDSNTSFPSAWVLRAQRVLQQRRHVLWQLGRLELNTRGVQRGLTRVRDSVANERSDRVDEAFVEPLRHIQQEIDRFDTPHTRPDGSWRNHDALFQRRFARHRPFTPFWLLLHARLSAWQAKLQRESR